MLLWFIVCGCVVVIKLGLLFLLIKILMFLVVIVDGVIGCLLFVLFGWDIWLIC